jgi:hypothetical protein
MVARGSLKQKVLQYSYLDRGLDAKDAVGLKRDVLLEMTTADWQGPIDMHVFPEIHSVTRSIALGGDERDT